MTLGGPNWKRGRKRQAETRGTLHIFPKLGPFLQSKTATPFSHSERDATPFWSAGPIILLRKDLCDTGVKWLMHLVGKIEDVSRRNYSLSALSQRTSSLEHNISWNMRVIYFNVSCCLG